jgi:hypothetical protein
MKARIGLDARKIILAYRLKPNDVRLNNYLIKEIGMPLQAACIYLINRCKLYRDLDNSIIALFPVESDDLLASFITYGNAEIPGSNILKKAFFRD